MQRTRQREDGLSTANYKTDPNLPEGDAERKTTSNRPSSIVYRQKADRHSVYT